ncbi:hypothetical protein BCR35DRAFT_310035 [Leucosporidium creatinivorum]|uniref:DUF7729 domain-containing protein n=1 Tax=Leucosporidium creatinivorum TaxID=106004 RepID=A0A1Y2D8N6_9BASI|nr:hypothetical protein BCR35DRAFT_310035 [Leucosporidium creatinivorum]
MPSTVSIVKALTIGLSLVAGVDAQSSSNSDWSSSSSSQASSASANATGSSTASAAASSSTVNTGANPLIPTSVSTGCQKFLTYLNGDETISACTLPLVQTLSLFAPSSSSTYDASSAEISQALDDLCTAQACDDSLIRTTLTQFSGNCSAELQASQAAVLGSYDTLYILSPFRTAVCAKDAEDGYCLTDIASGNVPVGSSAASSALASSVSANLTAAPTSGVNTTNNIVSLAATAKYTIPSLSPAELYFQVQSAARRLFRRQSISSSSSKSSSSSATSTSSAATSSASSNATSSSTLSEVDPSYALTGILPNSNTWRENSLPFLFLSTNMSSSLLCTQCTKTIFATYVSWESRIPYALGLSNSPILGSQGTLWTGIGEVCGSGFLSSIASQAGQSSLASGAGRIAVKGGVGLLAVALVALWM